MTELAETFDFRMQMALLELESYVDYLRYQLKDGGPEHKAKLEAARPFLREVHGRVDSLLSEYLTDEA